MTDKDVEREIEENQARVRDKEDIGLDENVLRQRENERDGSLIDDLGDAIRGKDEESREQEVEYRDNVKNTKVEPD